MSHQTGGHRRLEQDGTLERGQLARPESANGSLAGLAAYVDRRLEIGGRARRRVPILTLHRIVFLGDHRAVDRVSRARIAARESVAVAVDELRFVQRHAGAFGVGDARIDGQRRRFAFATHLDRLLDAEVPRVVQLQVAPFASQHLRIGEPGARVVGGEARDGKRLGDGVPDGVVREIRRARVAASRPDVHGDADALVAVVGDRFHVGLAHRHALPECLRHLGFRGRRAAAFGFAQHAVGDLGERVRGKRKSARRRSSGRDHRQGTSDKDSEGDRLS